MWSGSNGCVAVDVDPRDGGAAHLEERRNGTGQLPDTLLIETGQYGEQRGRHFWYRLDEARSSSGKNLKRGIQLKASGGYVLVQLRGSADRADHRAGPHDAEDMGLEFVVGDYPRDLPPSLIFINQERMD